MRPPWSPVGHLARREYSFQVNDTPRFSFQGVHDHWWWKMVVYPLSLSASVVTPPL